jgi:hypothetical protein
MWTGLKYIRMRLFFIISIPSKHNNYHHIYFDTTCFGSTEPSSGIHVSLLNCYTYVHNMITL